MMCALLPKVAGAQGTPTSDTFTVSDLTPSSNVFYFDVSLSGSNIYSAYNLSIFFPPTMTVARNNSNKLRVSMIKTDNIYPSTYDEDTGETTYSHTLSCEMPTSDELRVGCVSLSSEDLTKTSGKLFRVFVTLDNDAFTSSFSPKPIIKFSGLNLTTSAAVKYVPADFSCRPFTTGIPTTRSLNVNVTAANKIGTLILPFDAALPSGLKAYSCNAVDGDLLTLTPAESFEACKPYIIYAETGYSGTLEGTASLSDGSNMTDVFTNGYLTGVLTNTTVNTGYILQNQGDGPMFYDADGVTFSLPAGRCYLTPPTSPVKSFRFNFGDTDGIEEFQGTPLPNRGGAGGEALYDLSGRRVETPSRGIYIQGTRKVVNK